MLSHCAIFLGVAISPCVCDRFVASQKGYSNVVKILLSAGASVDLGKGTGATPLFIACEHGHAAIVKMLLVRAQASVNLVTQRCNAQGQVETLTPIYVACKHGHREVAELLMLARASIDANESGETPLSIAKQRGHTSVVQLLEDALAM